MADVRLNFYDLDADALPELCMRCGAPATVRPIKQFSWMPYWARFMPWMIGMAFMKRRRVPIPLCEQHKNHWMIRYLVVLGGLAAVAALGILGGVLIANDEHGPGAVVGGVLLFLAVVGFFAWLITAIVLGVTQINVVEITDDMIRLKHVHEDFVQAYREQTRGGFAPDVERIAREQFDRPGGRRPRDEGDEPRRPRRDDLPPDDKYRR